MSLFGWLKKKKVDAPVPQPEPVVDEPKVEEKPEPVVEPEVIEEPVFVEEPEVVEEPIVVVESEPVIEPEVVVEPEPAVEEKFELEKLTVADLRALAKDRGLTGYNTLKKAELIELLK